MQEMQVMQVKLENTMKEIRKPLWDAINRYVKACGGDPAFSVDHTPIEDIVKDVILKTIVETSLHVLKQV